MPGGNFEYELTVGPGGVVAACGPLDAGVNKVTEMDIWVFQKIDDVDAIANAMAPPGQRGLQVFNVGAPNARWEFPLPHKYGSPPFVDGSATAMGIGAFVDKQGHQTVYWWSEAVTLDVHH